MIRALWSLLWGRSAPPQEELPTPAELLAARDAMWTQMLHDNYEVRPKPPPGPRKWRPIFVETQEGPLNPDGVPR